MSAIQEQQQKIESRTETPKPTPQVRVPAPGAVNVGSSGGTSPVLSPNQSGHSLLAKRATSPHFPKPKVQIAPTMLVGQANAVQSRSRSPTVVVDSINGDASKVSLKRKAEAPASTGPGSTTGDGQGPKAKKRKATIQGPIHSSTELESMLIEWLKTKRNATTRDCIHHFTPYLVDSAKKTEFSAMVRKHATLKNGVLVGKE